jgi:putative chitinase
MTMIRITTAAIRALSDKERPELVAPIVAAMNEFLPAYDITTEKRVEHFLAQAAHESDGFRTLTEYASGAAYEGRDDLGNTEKGDGKRYRGRGIFQTTGRTNYAAAGKAMGIDALAEPELLATPRFAVWSACIYWKSRKLNALADKDDLRAITKKINGGYNGIEDRRRYLDRARRLIVETANAEADDPLIGPDSSPVMVRTLQDLLAAKAYNPGRADGKWGKLTRAAVLALKADNGLDTSHDEILLSQVRAAPVRVIESRQTATVADLRAEGSSTIKGADAVKYGSYIAGGAGLVGGTAEQTGALDQAEQISGTASRWFGVLEPFQGLMPFIAEWWWVILPVGAGGAWYLARRAQQKRLEEFKTGKMG